MIRSLILSGALALLVITGGCRLEQENSQETESQTQSQARLAAEAAAEIKASNLAAAQEHFFRPSAEEEAFLNAFVAVNALGTPNGYFTNQDGVSGYFQGYEQPFNFTWEGDTVEIEAFDGRRYRVIDGPGQLTLKYAGDDLLLQRYDGDYDRGLWHGHGRYWTRNREAGGHNYLIYQGQFKHDQMEGSGVLSNYNFSGQGNQPLQYTGELKGSLFHGWGQAVNLASGRMVYKGLWFEGQPFKESLDQWRSREAQSELDSLDRQYSDLLVTAQVRIGGAVNPRPGQGPLTIIPPLYTAKNVEVRDNKGHLHPLNDIRIMPPETEGPEEATIAGVKIDRPVGDYPLTLTISYDDRNNRRQLIHLKAKRPFLLQWEDEEAAGLPDQPGLSSDEELREELKAELMSIMEKGRKDRSENGESFETETPACDQRAQGPGQSNE